MNAFQKRTTSAGCDDETVVFQYGAIEIALQRLNLQITSAGVRQVLNGQIVTNARDRREFGRFLTLTTGSGASLLISLLIPAVQKMRD